MKLSFGHHRIVKARACFVVNLLLACMGTPLVVQAATNNGVNEARNFEGLWWPHEEPGAAPPPPPDASAPNGGGPPGAPPGQGPGGPSADSQLRVVECAPVQQLIIAGGGLSSLVFQSNTEIVMVAEFGMDFVRTIYLNKQHPKHLEPQVNGHSIGHWDGNTLVVDTVGFADKNGMDRGVHTVERITKNGTTFTDEVSIEERNQPSRQQTIRYDLQPKQPFNEYVCEESFDRYQFVNGQLDNPNIPPSRNRKDNE